MKPENRQALNVLEQRKRILHDRIYFDSDISARNRLLDLIKVLDTTTLAELRDVLAVHNFTKLDRQLSLAESIIKIEYYIKHVSEGHDVDHILLDMLSAT
jgi:hypothetical protein